MHQRRQTALENKKTRQNNRLREERRLQHSLLVSIKSTAALYFYNQKLMNQFFQNTLQHPYFQQFKLPLSFNQTLRKLGLGSDHVDKVNLDHKDADPNHDPDPVNHDLDVVGDDDNEDDDNDGDTHDHAQDDNQYSGDDRHQDLAVNALTLQPPSPLPNKSYIIFIQKCESFVYHWSQIQEKQCKSGLCYISR